MTGRAGDTERLTTIDLHMQALKFSAAHFTIFNATERERLHGHNYAVTCRITAPIGDDGLTCDYAIFKNKLFDIVNDLDEYTIIAGQSPHLRIEEEGVFFKVFFDDHFMMLRQPETRVLPVKNATVEEFSYYILGCLCQDEGFLKQHEVRRLEVTVASGPGQHGSAVWEVA
jgi:6-pyruvoyltetrahydropterin/6-carboxytetrahydropterin synthase